MRKLHILLLCFLSSLIGNAQNLPNAPSAQKAKLDKISNDTGWPRTFKNESQEFIIYQPQVDKWDGARVYLYSAVELKSSKKKPSNYGVVWFSARTEVDKVNRLVTLDQVETSKVQFPAAKDQESIILTSLQAKMPGRTKTITLDRMEAALKAAAPKFDAVEVKNDPPKIIFSTKPSLLVTIDGEPRLVEVKTTQLKRVVNTTAIMLIDENNKKYYLRVMDWWLESPQIEGPWNRANNLSDDMKKAEEYMVTQTKAQVGASEGGESAEKNPKPGTKQVSLKEQGKSADIPTVFVVYSPAELVETQGEPQYEIIPGAGIQYVKNTNATILRVKQDYYILLSGRWFKSSSLGSSWTFVDRERLPAEFAKVPVESPMAKILVSVPGTPQAEEALIANSIPQTATITRSEAKLTVVYDGEPTFVPIEGTTLKYARNTSAPVIKVSDDNYYSVESGVWFKAPTPQGGWRVAESVPDVIYTIPASSPLHYVTYAKVYGATPEVVYVGYTPGYYGTIVSSSTTTVVYGTGWYYPPYIGPTVWYGYPYTYGVGAGFTWTDTSGWSFGFGFGYTYYPYYPWWGPMGYYGCCWYPYYGWGAWGGAAAANVYGRWGNTAYSRTAAAWANPYTGNYGAARRGATYNTETGRVAAGGRGYNTNIYTGNTAGYRGGAVYDPNSGIVAGAGAGFAGNRYTGEGTAGRGGFVYNTNTNAGIAAGKNNIYAGKDGTVYRYDRGTGNWSQNSGNGWQSADPPGGGSGNKPTLQRQQEARAQGTQRSQNFSSTRSSGNFNRGMSRGMGGRRR